MDRFQLGQRGPIDLAFLGDDHLADQIIRTWLNLTGIRRFVSGLVRFFLRIAPRMCCLGSTIHRFCPNDHAPTRPADPPL